MVERKVAIIGGAGQLGRQLLLEYPDAYAPRRDELDINDALQVMNALEGYDLVINCAAMHDMKKCEEVPAAAFMANAGAVLALAAVAKKLIHISTNYVFDGKPTAGVFNTAYGYYEHDATNPMSVYGASKRAGELIVLYTNPNHLVVRTSGLYGPGGPSGKNFNFVDAVKAGKYKRVKDDEWANQTSCADLARGIKRNEDRRGVLHLVNWPAMTWYEFARMINEGVEPVPRKEFDDGIYRPQYGGMCSIFDMSMMSTKDALDEYLAR